MNTQNIEKITAYDTTVSKEIVKINWTYNSNAIEGNTLSLGDTAEIIQYGLTIKGKPIIEHSEVVGHARAIDILYKLIQKDRFEEEELFLLHKAVQTNLVVDIESPLGAYKVVENGRYIKLPNGDAKFVPYPHPKDISYLMSLWFDSFSKIKECDSFESCVTLYTDMHLSLTAIHPFFDANGRVARLIANIPLIKSHYLPIIVNHEDREEYIKFLANYNLKAPSLNKKSKVLIEKNSEYEKLKEFFKEQYKNSKELLEMVRK
jgi:Fic family protein